MADEQALDQAIQELSTAVDAIVAKASEADIDLTDEVASIKEITGRIGDALAAPAAPPAEEPPAEEPPAE